MSWEGLSALLSLSLRERASGLGVAGSEATETLRQEG
jgi:hypothetical protein